MTRAPIRSTLFNLAFYGVTMLCCFVLLPALLLPRPAFLGVVRAYLYIITALEYSILGLKYEVRGRENLPKEGSYIIACKHQSAYETFKLRLIFDDPAIVLKKELLKIPLWGTYLNKSDVIAIDRSTPMAAARSLKEGAQRIAAQGRPIIIFPQGTRVWPYESAKDKPYKNGPARLQEATNLPIVPIALNSGMFWPRSGWLKSSGTVVFDILRPVKPGKERKKLMSEIESKIEKSSEELMSEARLRSIEKKPVKGWWALGVLAGLLLLLGGTYTILWHKTALEVQRHYASGLRDVEGINHAYSAPVITGFPGAVRLEIKDQSFENTQGRLSIENMRAIIWPLPYVPANIKTDGIRLYATKWGEPITFDSADITLHFELDNRIVLQRSTLKSGEFTGRISGFVDTAQKPLPRIDILLEMFGYSDFIASLVDKQILDDRMAMFLGAGFSSLAQEDGGVRVPIHQKNRKIYAGPIPIFTLPARPEPEPDIFIGEDGQSIDSNEEQIQKPAKDPLAGLPPVTRPTQENEEPRLRPKSLLPLPPAQEVPEVGAVPRQP